MNEQRGNLYLLTGLLIGIFLGLLFAWVISPVRYTDIDPSALEEADKDEYRRVIALAYQANGNLDRARQRLALLDSQDSVQILAAQAQRMLADNRPPQEARAVAVLAAQLGRPQDSIISSPSPQAVDLRTRVTQATQSESTATSRADLATATLETVAAVQTPTLPPPTKTATVTRTSPPTFTPRPTATPLPILDAPFVLTEKKEVCDGNIQEGLVRIYVTGSDGVQLPGIQITVLWQNEQDVFFTGLVPENGAGYADFLMKDNISYTIRVGSVSDSLENLVIPGCGGGWDITFQQGKQ